LDIADAWSEKTGHHADKLLITGALLCSRMEPPWPVLFSSGRHPSDTPRILSLLPPTGRFPLASPIGLPQP